MSRATLGDLVKDFLRLELGYGEEIVVNHGADLLYDVEETDNLTKKLGELGMLSGLSLFLLLTGMVRHQRRQLLDYYRRGRPESEGKSSIKHSRSVSHPLPNASAHQLMVFQECTNSQQTRTRCQLPTCTHFRCAIFSHTATEEGCGVQWRYNQAVTANYHKW
jgi:hypothetical protein